LHQDVEQLAAMWDRPFRGVRARLGWVVTVIGCFKWLLDSWGRWDAFKELASHFPAASRFLAEPWVTPTIIIVGLGVVVWASLDPGGTIGFDNLQFLPEHYRQKRLPHEYIVGGGIIVFLIVFGVFMHDRVIAHQQLQTHPLEWVAYGMNYGRIKETDKGGGLKNNENFFWTVTAISPSQDVSAPMTLKLTFSQEILGEPLIENLTPSDRTHPTRPLSLSILKHEGQTVIVEIADPLKDGDAIFVKVVSRSPATVQVSCVACPSK
jgi:hypothetical protein